MAWLTDYSYRKEIDISRASGAVSNYQMKLLVGESSGATGEDVDCAGHVLSNFNDLRFATSDGTTLLDYWIESITGATPNQLATVWIEFDSIGTGATNFYMYYGNAGAAAASNIKNTFISGDDFEWGNDEDDITTSPNITWSKAVAGTSTAKIDTAQAYYGTKSLRLYRDGTNTPAVSFARIAGNNSYAIQLRMRKDATSGIIFTHGDGSHELYAYVKDTEDIFYAPHSPAGEVDTTANATINTWELYEFTNINFAGPSYDISFNGSSIANDASMYDDVYYDDIFQLTSYRGTSNIWIDHVIVRNWVATEPAWGSWGTEEVGTVVKDIIQSGMIAFPR